MPPNAELVELPDLQYGIFDVEPDQLAAKVRPSLKAPQRDRLVLHEQFCANALVTRARLNGTH